MFGDEKRPLNNAKQNICLNNDICPITHESIDRLVEDRNSLGIVLYKMSGKSGVFTAYDNESLKEWFWSQMMLQAGENKISFDLTDPATMQPLPKLGLFETTTAIRLFIIKAIKEAYHLATEIAINMLTALGLGFGMMLIGLVIEDSSEKLNPYFYYAVFEKYVVKASVMLMVSLLLSSFSMLLDYKDAEERPKIFDAWFNKNYIKYDPAIHKLIPTEQRSDSTIAPLSRHSAVTF
jgi:hypothetical protein